MAIFKTDQFATDGRHYHLEDYHDQKEQYLKSVEQKAAEILEDAREKAKSIIQQAYRKGVAKAAEEVARVKAEGEKQGYEEGLKKGETEIKQRLEQENQSKIDPLVNQLNAVTENLKQHKDGLLQTAEEQLVESAFSLAQAVIQVEVQQNPEILKEKLKKALSHLHSSMNLEVRIHPEDSSLAKSLMPKIQELMGSTSVVIWREDAELDRSSVVVSSGQSQVDLRTELQWEQLLGELKNQGVS